MQNTKHNFRWFLENLVTTNDLAVRLIVVVDAVITQATYTISVGIANDYVVDNYEQK